MQTRHAGHPQLEAFEATLRTVPVLLVFTKFDVLKLDDSGYDPGRSLAGQMAIDRSQQHLARHARWHVCRNDLGHGDQRSPLPGLLCLAKSGAPSLTRETRHTKPSFTGGLSKARPHRRLPGGRRIGEIRNGAPWCDRPPSEKRHRAHLNALTFGRIGWRGGVFKGAVAHEAAAAVLR